MDNKDNQDISEIEEIIDYVSCSHPDTMAIRRHLNAIAQTQLLILKELRKPKV